MTRLPLFGLLLVSVPNAGSAQIPTFDQDMHTQAGIQVGETIPPFMGLDQTGRTVDFDSVKGPQGLVVLFFRSADW